MVKILVEFVLSDFMEKITGVVQSSGDGEVRQHDHQWTNILQERDGLPGRDGRDFPGFPEKKGEIRLTGPRGKDGPPGEQGLVGPIRRFSWCNREAWSYRFRGPGPVGQTGLPGDTGPQGPPCLPDPSTSGSVVFLVFLILKFYLGLRMEGGRLPVGHNICSMCHLSMYRSNFQLS